MVILQTMAVVCCRFIQHVIMWRRLYSAGNNPFGAALSSSSVSIFWAVMPVEFMCFNRRGGYCGSGPALAAAAAYPSTTT